jgi:catechol 2,3-dioxygenase-like lactoylglutathione lyase family enzyme
MILRVARHTTHLQPLINFYTTILGLEITGDFKDHAGYHGVFIGGKNSGWHLEFTESSDAPEHTAEDDLLVFYASAEEYKAINERMMANNIKPVTSKNPYWKENGITILDPDGFRVVISY